MTETATTDLAGRIQQGTDVIVALGTALILAIGAVGLLFVKLKAALLDASQKWVALKEATRSVMPLMEALPPDVRTVTKAAMRASIESNSNMKTADVVNAAVDEVKAEEVVRRSQGQIKTPEDT